MYNVVLKGGTIVDGENTPPFKADLAIEGDRIAAIAPVITDRAKNEINCENLVVAPGFIDFHSHSDLVIPDYPATENFIRQGVTTEVVGQCGFSPAPVPVVCEKEFYEAASALRVSSQPFPFRTFAQYLDYLDSLDLSINVAALVGHGPIRGTVMGFSSRPPSSDELKQMEDEVELAFNAGAWGLSTGLTYPPGCFAQAPELTALARVVAKRGRLYFSHIRGEGDTLLESLEEFITIGESAGSSIQLSHFKSSGARNWSKQQTAVAMIDAARERGVDIMADVMSTAASGTTLSSLLPDWMKAGGPAQMMERLNDATLRAAVKKNILEGMEGWSNVFMAVGFDKFFIFGAPSFQDQQGQSIAEMASKRGIDSIDMLLDILATDGAAIFTVFLTMLESNVEEAMKLPYAMVGSDGWAHANCPGCTRLPHPRSFGTYPKVLGTFVRDRRIFPLEEAVHKMTAMPADRLGILDRGRLKAGLKADVVVFDPLTVRDTTSLTSPANFPDGIPYVFVNGEESLSNGQFRPGAGKVLRKPR
jgi:N-acyl-D-aspartate/D-glutamate deacylase